MEDELFLLNYNPTLVYFTFYVVFFIVMGFILYMLMTRPSTRRENFSNLSAVPPPLAICICLLIAIPGISYTYLNTWAHFYAALGKGPVITLKYLCPQRTMEIEAKNVLKVDKSAYFARGMSGYRVTITDTSGNVYKSIVTNRNFADKAIQSIISETGK